MTGEETKIGEEVYIHGYIDEIRKDIVIIRNEGGYFGTVPSEIKALEQEPITNSETLISLDVYNQVAKERDIAIEQLHELGYEFGQKIESTTKNDLGVDNTPNTISFKEMMDRLNLTTNDIEKAEDLDFEIESLMPSYSNLLKANNQLKMQIEMLKLDRDCDKPSGKWIVNAPQYDMLNPQYICSECGNAHIRTTPYCEMCGAKMVEPQERKDNE